MKEEDKTYLVFDISSDAPVEKLFLFNSAYPNFVPDMENYTAHVTKPESVYHQQLAVPIESYDNHPYMCIGVENKNNEKATSNIVFNSGDNVYMLENENRVPLEPVSSVQLGNVTKCHTNELITPSENASARVLQSEGPISQGMNGIMQQGTMSQNVAGIKNTNGTSEKWESVNSQTGTNGNTSKTNTNIPNSAALQQNNKSDEMNKTKSNAQNTANKNKDVEEDEDEDEDDSGAEKIFKCLPFGLLVALCFLV